MNKLRTQAVVAFCLFLVIVLGGASIFYFLFAEDYYVEKKKSLMNTAFQDLRQLDLDNVAYENDTSITSLENESFSLIICDENFEQVYSSKIRSTDDSIQYIMIPARDRFSEDASAVYEKDVYRKPVSLYGLIRQDGHTYYIYIYENTYSIRKSINYVNHFLMMTLLVALILGSGFAWLICSQIVKPVVRISNVAKKISENDFSVRASESIPSFELQQLAKNINQMADKIQRDINDLNNYNYLLLRQNRNMAEFEDIRKTIVSKMTHELKTPLAIISSQVEMLQYEYDDTKKDYYFSSIMEEIEKMSGLISNILNNSFTDSSLPSTLMARDDLSVLLDTLIPKYTCWMTSSNIRFTTSVQEDCFAVFDPMQIEQVINNYIMNAWNHTKPGHQIILTLRQDEESLYCSVYNEGSHIPETEQEHIWKSFYQADQQNSGSSTEIGLGLFIVRDIIRLHRGTCGVFNCRKGVEFWFRLPKA